MAQKMAKLSDILTDEDVERITAEVVKAGVPLPQGKRFELRRLYHAADYKRLHRDDLYAKINGVSNLLHVIFTNAGNVLIGFRSIHANKTLNGPWRLDNQSFIGTVRTKNAKNYIFSHAVKDHPHHVYENAGYFSPYFGGDGCLYFGKANSELNTANGAYTDIVEGNGYQVPVGGPHALNGGVRNLGPIADFEAFTLTIVDDVAPAKLSTAIEAEKQEQAQKIAALEGEKQQLIAEKQQLIATTTATETQLKQQLTASQADARQLTQALAKKDAELAVVLSEMKELKARLGRTELESVMPRITTATTDAIIRVVEAFGIDLDPSLVVREKLTGALLINAHKCSSLLEDLSEAVTHAHYIAILRLFCIVRATHTEKRVPKEEFVADWLAGSAFSAHEPVFRQNNVSAAMLMEMDGFFAASLGISAATLKAIKAAFSAANPVTVLIPM